MNWVLLSNSLLVSASSACLAVALGWMAALWIAGLERCWRALFLAATVITLALPPFLVTNCWLHYLGAAGVWRHWLPFNILSLSGATWIMGLSLWPLTTFAVLSAWQQLEPSQLESDPSVSGWALARALLFPTARTALAQAALVTVVLALNNFAVPTILQVQVFPEVLWVRFNTSFDSLGALKLSWPLLITPVLMLWWLGRRELPWPRAEGAVSPGLFRRQLGARWNLASGVVALLVCSLGAGLPLFQLIGLKRTWVELPGALAAGKTTVWNSLFFAVATASGVIGLALVTGMRTPLSADPKHRLRNNWRMNAGLILWLPFLLPGVLLGIALIKLFNRSWSAAFYQSASIVILAFLIRYLALGWSAVRHAIGTVDRDLMDASRIEGVTRWQMLRYVQWPQISAQVAAAWYIVFLLCLWDVESMILVVPPGGETLSLRIFNLLHYGHNAQVNALCVTLLGIALVPLVLWNLWRTIRDRWTRIPVHQKKDLGQPKRLHHMGLYMILGLSFLLLGCEPPVSSNEMAIDSKLFSHVQVIGSRGVGVGEFNKPRSLAVDARDNLYVVDMTGRVQKFSTNGGYLLSWQMPQTDKGKPKGMCRDREGNIIVVEPHYQRVNYFSPKGKLVGQWGEYGTNAGQFSMPRAAAVDSRGEIFVSEYGLIERVERFSSFGRKFLNTFGHMGSEAREFNRPEGLCVDAQDRLYVADSCNHRIQVFSSDGTFLRAYGKAGSGFGELSYPYDICVDSAGRQYVCEFGNSRIQIFDANDRPVEIIGGPGAEPGRFSNPWGVALDASGNLYVADSQNHRVQKFIRKAAG